MLGLASLFMMCSVTDNEHTAPGYSRDHKQLLHRRFCQYGCRAAMNCSGGLSSAILLFFLSLTSVSLFIVYVSMPQPYDTRCPLLVGLTTAPEA